MSRSSGWMAATPVARRSVLQALGLAASGAAWAQAGLYPQRPVRMMQNSAQGDHFFFQ